MQKDFYWEKIEIKGSDLESSIVMHVKRYTKNEYVIFLGPRVSHSLLARHVVI